MLTKSNGEKAATRQDDKIGISHVVQSMYNVPLSRSNLFCWFMLMFKAGVLACVC